MDRLYQFDRLANQKNRPRPQEEMHRSIQTEPSCRYVLMKTSFDYTLNVLLYMVD
jgi:hypothetical protein